MKFGDTIKLDMLDSDGQSIFGSIEQRVVQYLPPKQVIHG